MYLAVRGQRCIEQRGFGIGRRSVGNRTALLLAELPRQAQCAAFEARLYLAERQACKLVRRIDPQ